MRSTSTTTRSNRAYVSPPTTYSTSQTSRRGHTYYRDPDQSVEQRNTEGKHAARPPRTNTAVTAHPGTNSPATHSRIYSRQCFRGPGMAVRSCLRRGSGFFKRRSSNTVHQADPCFIVRCAHQRGGMGWVLGSGCVHVVSKPEHIRPWTAQTPIGAPLTTTH